MNCKACWQRDCICDDTWEPVDVDVADKEPRELARDDFCRLWGERFGTVEECHLAFDHAVKCWYMHVEATTNTEMSQLMGANWEQARLAARATIREWFRRSFDKKGNANERANDDQ